jgi:hypothetical protein
MWSGFMILDDLKKMAGAIPILTEWLGDGMTPVDSMTTVERVKSCLSGFNGKKCPYNIAPNWAQKHISDPIAKVMLQQLRIRDEAKMALPKHLESKAHYCSKCGCNILLKITVPIQHISDHTDLQQLEQYPDFCWIAKEIKGE